MIVRYNNSTNYHELGGNISPTKTVYSRKSKTIKQCFVSNIYSVFSYSKLKLDKYDVSIVSYESFYDSHRSLLIV